VTAAVALGPLPVAGAHGTDPSIRTVLDVVEPAIPGVEIQVQASVSAEVVAENTTATELVVLAETGEPFLRIGPEGVLANLASPSWYLSNSPFGDAGVPEDASPDAAPRWGRVSREPSWGWFDHRLHPEPRGAPRSLPADGGALRLARWSIPFRYGDESVVARGRVEYAPAPGVVTARLQGPERPFADVAVQLAPGRIPGLYVTNTGAVPIVVLGASGEPFLRIGRDGVEANRHSPTWIDNARARDQDLTAAAAEADPGAAPDWTLVSTAPNSSWLEFRGNYARGEPPRAVVDAGETRVLRRWSVPIVRGDRRVEVQGETIWRAADGGGGGSDGPFPTGVVVGVAVGVGLALIAVFRWRPARRR